MIEIRQFPVLNQQQCRPSERKIMPCSVPWSFAETFREQARINHDQTLERLAERGGLAPEEMWVAAHGYRWFEAKRLELLPDEQLAIDWLVAAVAAHQSALWGAL